MAAALALVMVTGAVGAAAQPAPQPDGTAGPSVVLDTDVLGLDTSVSFPGLSAERTLAIPVPDGLLPASLDAVLELPPALARATLDVRAEDRLLQRVDLPTEVGARVSIPLDGVRAYDGVAVVTLRSQLIPLEGWCLFDWRDLPMRLADPTVRYTGQEEQPATVAAFLPPALRTLTVYLPPTPTPAEVGAAAELGSGVVAEYLGQPVKVEVRRLPDGAPRTDHTPGLLERQVALREGGDPGITLTTGVDGPLLLVTGQGEALRDQVRFLLSDMARLAVTPRVAAGEVAPQPVLAAEALTLEQLGEGERRATSIGYVSVSFGIDQTRLGRPARNVRVRLRGGYTPLPSGLNGRVFVTVSGREVASWAASPDGRIDQWVTVPDELLGRFTTVTVTLQAAGMTSECGLEQPVTLVLDAESEVLSDPADPPVPGGFEAFPQALQPQLRLGLSDGGFDDARRAVALVTGLQRLTPVPLHPLVVPFAEAAAGGSAVLVAAGGAVPDNVALPLRQVEQNRLDLLQPGDDDTTSVQVRPGIEFGSLQAAHTGGRMVLVATSTNAPELVDALLAWLGEDVQRWDQLRGDVLFLAQGGEPEMLNLAVGDPAAPPAARGLLARLAAPVAAVLAAAALSAAAVVGWRRLRRR